MYVNGIDPGFSGDLLQLTALSLTERAESILVQEICDYGSYDDAEFTGELRLRTSPDTVPMPSCRACSRRSGAARLQLLADELVWSSTNCASATRPGLPPRRSTAR